MGKYYMNRVVLEFNTDKENEKEIYNKLKQFSHPAAIVKDIITGVLPVEILTGGTLPQNKDIEKETEEEDDDDMFVDIS